MVKGEERRGIDRGEGGRIRRWGERRGVKYKEREEIRGKKMSGSECSV